jgi:glycerol-3-phosphate cytidylyltransferase
MTEYSILHNKDKDIFTDKTIDQINDIKKQNSDKKIVFTASCFDLLHPGHILMLEDAKKQGDILVIGLHSDPTINRDSKNKPVQTFEERSIMIHSNKFVDYVIDYATEDDLLNILKHLNPDVRVLGSDWEGKQYTGHELSIPVYFHKRNHDWSTSKLRKRVFDAEFKYEATITSKINIPNSLWFGNRE